MEKGKISFEDLPCAEVHVQIHETKFRPLWRSWGMGHLQLVETGCKPCVPQEDGHPFLELQALCFFQPLHPSMLLHAFPRAWSMGRSKSKTRKKGKEDERKKACVSCRIPCSLSNTKKEIKWRTGRSGLMKRVILQNLNQEDNAVKMSFNHWPHWPQCHCSLALSWTCAPPTYLCLSILGDLEESHVFVPYWSQTISCFNLNAKQLVDQLEHAFHHLRERKVWSKNLIIDIELSFAHSFRPITYTPRRGGERKKQTLAWKLSPTVQNRITIQQLQLCLKSSASGKDNFQHLFFLSTV